MMLTRRLDLQHQLLLRYVISSSSTPVAPFTASPICTDPLLALCHPTAHLRSVAPLSTLRPSCPCPNGRPFFRDIRGLRCLSSLPPPFSNNSQNPLRQPSPSIPKTPSPRPSALGADRALPPPTVSSSSKLRTIWETVQGYTLQGIWQAVKHELIHYWTGTKLLWANIGVSKDLTLKLMNGDSLSRREKRLLRRTTMDVLRVFPFLLFVIVPFLEFALPIFLKLFPNMLPSTFESSLQKE